jgi:hypothetical protein
MLHSHKNNEEITKLEIAPLFLKKAYRYIGNNVYYSIKEVVIHVHRKIINNSYYS